MLIAIVALVRVAVRNIVTPNRAMGICVYSLFPGEGISLGDAPLILLGSTWSTAQEFGIQI